MLTRSIAALALGLSLAAVGAQPVADLSGSWSFRVSADDPSGPQNVTLTLVFAQAGDSLTGSQGDAKVAGAVVGDTVVFDVEGKDQSGAPYRTSYRGTIQSPTRMSGSVSLAAGPGKWTAVKKGKK